MYYIWIITAVIFLLDRISKLLIISNIDLGTSQPVVPHFFYLTYIENKGAAFGLFAGGAPFFIMFTLVVGGVAVLLLRKMIPRLTKPIAICLGLILGGALGNFVDRAYWGYVVDFLDFRVFPFIFNLADSALVVGSLMLAALMFFGESVKTKNLESVGASESTSVEEESVSMEIKDTLQKEENVCQEGKDRH